MRWRERLIVVLCVSMVLCFVVFVMYGVFVVYLIVGILIVCFGFEMWDVILSDFYMVSFVAEMEYRFVTYFVFVFVLNVDFVWYVVVL